MDPSYQASSSRTYLLSKDKSRPERSSRSRNVFSSLINRSSRTQISKTSDKQRLSKDMQNGSILSISSLINTKGIRDDPDTEYIDVLEDVVPVRSESQDYFIVPGYGQMSKSRMDDAVVNARRRRRGDSTAARVPVQTFYGKYDL